MKIQSTFKDFYDVAQQYGQDQGFIYRRIPKTEDLTGRDHPVHQFNVGLFRSRLSNRRLSIEPFIVGFCGKIYPGLLVDLTGSVNTKECRERRRFCYSIEDVDKFVAYHFKQKDQEFYNEPFKVVDHGSYRTFAPWKQSRENTWDRDECHSALEFWFTNTNTFYQKSQYLKKFESEYCPIFVIQPNIIPFQREANKKITYNGNIGDLDFVRIFPPHEAYQEISMFLGSMAEPRKKIPEHDDLTKVQIAGFDKKLSFRKDPIRKRK